MPLAPLETIYKNAPEGRALLGVDVGTRTLGLALSNPEQTFATPLQTIRRGGFSQDMIAMESLITAYEVGGFVVGYPLHMDGGISAGCDRARSFADEMRTYLLKTGLMDSHTLWIALVDERLSTATAHERAAQAQGRDYARKTSKKSGIIDSLAAQVILQSALDYMARQGGRYESSGF